MSGHLPFGDFCVLGFWTDLPFDVLLSCCSVGHFRLLQKFWDQRFVVCLVGLHCACSESKTTVMAQLACIRSGVSSRRRSSSQPSDSAAVSSRSDSGRPVKAVVARKGVGAAAKPAVKPAVKPVAKTSVKEHDGTSPSASSKAKPKADTGAAKLTFSRVGLQECPNATEPEADGLQAIPTLEIEAVVDASTCKDFSCDKCDRCVSKARWDKKGSDWARKCASKASGKLFLWASWQNEGVGCLCCCNHLLAKQNKTPNGARNKVCIISSTTKTRAAID